MSAASRARQAQRAQEREEDKAAAEHDREVATLYGIWRVPNAGYSACVVELPRSLVEKYAVEVSEPDLMSITLGGLVKKIERKVLGG